RSKRLLLQAQRLSSKSRPIPTVDVFAASALSPKLRKRQPEFFKGINLTSNDLAVVSSEEYSPANSDSDSESDVGDVHSRRIVAVVCHVPKKEAKQGNNTNVYPSEIGQVKKNATAKVLIRFGDGSTWEASKMSNGVGYEFQTLHGDGDLSICRWIRR